MNADSLEKHMRLPRILAILLTTAVIGWATVGQPVVALAADAPEAAHGAAGADEPSLLRGPKESVITAVTTLVVFVALVAVLGKFAWGPIASGLQAREDKIRKDIADAEAARQRAEQTLKEYSARLSAAEAQIRDMLAKAQSDAEGVAAGIKVQAQQDAEEIKERATKEIDASKNAALAELHEHAATLATNVASKILRRNINADDQRELVRTSLDELSAVAGR